MERCEHFNGLINDVCKAGVSYETVRDASTRPYRYPCLSGNGLPCATTCAMASYPTEAEAHEYEKRVEAHSAAYSRDLAEGRCPICHQPAKKRQVGRCVYGDPCGHRMYQGKAR